MATYDVCDTEIRPMPAPAGLFAPLLPMWTRIQARIDERRAIHHLYRLDARVLRDMGFDPHAIYAAHEGAISEWKTRRCGED
jgi:hypothetical protein